MDFDGDYVGAFYEECRVDVSTEEGRNVISYGCAGGSTVGAREGGVGDRPIDHVVADHLSPVQINDNAVVPLVIHDQAAVTGRVRDHEGLAVIGGCIFVVRIGAVGIG